MDSIRQISEKFGLEGWRVQDFFVRVQRCFKSNKPKYTLLAQFIFEENLTVFPSPRDLAIRVVESGKWPFVLNSELPVPMNNYIPVKRPRRSN